MTAKDKKKKNSSGNWYEFGNLLKTVRFPWRWMALAFACNMLFSEVTLHLPTTTAALMSGSLERKVIIDAIMFYVSYTLLLCADTALRSPAQHFAVRNARRAFWKRMLHIRMDYYDGHDPSDMMSTITNDASDSMKNLVRYIVGFIPDLYYAVRALATISSYNIWLMMSVLSLLPIKIIYMIYIGRCRYRTESGVYHEIGGLTAYLAERVHNLSLIKTYTNEARELKNGENVAQNLFNAKMKVIKLECGITALTTFIGLLQTSIVMVFGVVMLNRGEITIQQWVAFYMFAGTLSNTFSTLISYWTDLKTIQGTLSRASHMLTVPAEEKAGKGDNIPHSKSIEFNNVSFAYGEKPALMDVSFTIPEGSATAIVGLCGSGKTTSISLIEDFYEPMAGQVKIGGISVSDFSLDALRTLFGYTQQGADIFSGTLREALTYGIKREVSDEEIMKAAERSGFVETINAWEKRLDTPIAVGGTSLSGGQRQKLVFTREFLRNADILLLDEPTSALDTIASQAIQKAIFELFPGKTKIIVTHDLKLMEKVDQIVVLDKGNLSGFGTYDQLMDECKLFQELVATQHAREEDVQ